MLTSGIAWIDAVFLTHDHADHLNGLDDIRVFTWHRVMPFYAAADVCRQLRNRFSYIFGNPTPGGGVPNLDLQEMGPGGITIGEMEILPVPIMHGQRIIRGYRIGTMAYLTDCSGIPSESYSLLQDLDVLIIGALRYRPHPTHFSIDQAVAAAKTIGAKQTYLTHLCHDVEHSAVLQDLPATVSPAYDGLTLEL